MRILYVHRNVLPSRDANTVHVMRMCEAFAALGHDVLLVASRRHNEVGDDEVHRQYGVEGFELHRVRLSTVRPTRVALLRWMMAIARQALGYRPDLVYGRDPVGLCTAMLTTRSVGVYEAHKPFPDPESRVGPASRLALSTIRAHHRMRGIVAISDALRSNLEATTSDLRTPVYVAHDAADLRSSQSDLEPAIQRGDRLAVGYLGHLYPGKGMEVIVPLANACPWANFHVVGGKEDDIRRWESDAEGVPNLFLHGYVSPVDTPRYLASFDVALAPYQRRVEVAGGSALDVARWMSPLKIFEYMAHGIPMIASDLPVLREVLEHGKTALLASPDDLRCWVDALEDLRDPSLRRQLGERAKSQFVSHHTWMARAKHVLEQVGFD